MCIEKYILSNANITHLYQLSVGNLNHRFVVERNLYEAKLIMMWTISFQYVSAVYWTQMEPTK